MIYLLLLGAFVCTGKKHLLSLPLKKRKYFFMVGGITFVHHHEDIKRMSENILPPSYICLSLCCTNYFCGVGGTANANDVQGGAEMPFILHTHTLCNIYLFFF